MIKKFCLFSLLISVFISGCNLTNSPSLNKLDNNSSLKVETTASTTTASTTTASTTTGTLDNEKGYIFKDSDNQIIDNTELDNCDKFTLLLAKNEIFARKGYKFNSRELIDYYSNMGWYKPVESAKGTFDDLNDIEKKNFNLIENKYNRLNDSVMDGQDEYKKSIKKDINDDGIDEIITVLFTKQYDSYSSEYSLTVSSGGKDFNLKGSAENIEPDLFIADFNVNDKTTEFYINFDGPSDDPGTKIFQFAGDSIKEINNIEGHIRSYDGKGRIYADYNKTNDKNKIVLSYYELGKGTAIPPKSEVINKYLQYDWKLIVFNNIRDESGKNAPFMSNTGTNDDKELQQYLDKQYKRGQIIKVTKPNEKLKIIDIAYNAYSNIGVNSTRNIPIKVELNDGKQGWLVWLNGGD